MFLEERQNKIVQLVSDNGRVKVGELATLFHVTEDCVRKDLRQLETEGKLKRVYGGAVSIPASNVTSFQSRLTVNTESKRVIAERAYAQIENGETIFLDTSTTTYVLAQLLAEGSKSCVVVSTMLDALLTMSANPLLQVIGTGGDVNTELGGFMGSTTIAMLAEIKFNRAFFGALGIDSASGDVTTFHIDDAHVKRQVMQSSSYRFLLAESTKFDAPGSYRYGNLSSFDAVFTEKSTALVQDAVAKADTILL